MGVNRTVNKAFFSNFNKYVYKCVDKHVLTKI